MKLIFKTVVGFFIFIGGMFLIGVVLDAADSDKDIRPWVAGGTILFFLVAVTLAVLVQKRTRLRRAMGQLNERIESAKEPGDFMKAWADMAAVLFSDDPRQPLPLTMKSIVRLDRDFAEIDVNRQFPDPEEALKVTLAISAFLGEYVRTVTGGTWEKQGQFRFHLLVPGRGEFDAMGVVVKRFTKDGVVSWSDTCRQMTAPESVIAQPRLEAAVSTVSSLLRELTTCDMSDEKVIPLGTRIAATALAAYAKRDEPLPCTAESVDLIEKLYLTHPAVALLKTDAFVIAVGAFVGECIRLQHGGTWIRDQGTMPWLLKVSDKMTCNPMGKVAKFFDVGAEESFYSLVRTTTALLKPE